MIDKSQDERFVQIIPSARQIAYQQLEFYAFIHFTVNTFTGKEWGDGTESEQIFNPSKMDTDQWAASLKEAGMKAAILTCKHHDGFCLWPSAYTEHTVANSPYKNGKGDVVREFSDSCKKFGLKFGIYLSPWDRNNKLYGTGKEYNDFFVHQLTELLTQYGDIFDVWFDGACGEGLNGKKQIYDWKRYYETIRQLQPGACINVCGPDIRWCGNEGGYTRSSEWSIVPKRTQDTEKIKESSQQTDDDEFRERKIKATDEDLGSRNAIFDEKELVWYPAEVNTSIRPGWFYHQEEDDKVKSLSELVSIYENSVGGNATFLLNVPPTKAGLLHKNDVNRLKEIGQYLKNTFHNNLVKYAKLEINEDISIQNKDALQILQEDSYDQDIVLNPTQKKATLILHWDEPVMIQKIVLKENIEKSQRVEAYQILDDKDEVLFTGTVIGYKKIVTLNNIRTNQIKIQILDSRKETHLSFLGIYNGDGSKLSNQQDVADIEE